MEPRPLPAIVGEVFADDFLEFARFIALSRDRSYVVPVSPLPPGSSTRLALAEVVWATARDLYRERRVCSDDCLTSRGSQPSLEDLRLLCQPPSEIERNPDSVNTYVEVGHAGARAGARLRQRVVAHDLTKDAPGAPAAAPGSALTGYVSVNPNQQHVNYLTMDGHVHELVYDNGWHHRDLTKDAGAPLAAPGSALHGYMSFNPNQQHVNYLGEDGRVYELVYDNGWSPHDLTSDAGATVNAAGKAVYYGVIEYDVDNRQILSVLTHEVYEAVTDPDVETGYFDHIQGAETEIGDLCNKQMTPMDGYSVQKLWSQRNCGCV